MKIKKFNKILSLFLSLVLLIQVVALPSTYGMASEKQTDSNSEKSYESMLNSIVQEKDKYPTKNGIWINEVSKGYFLSIINNLSDQKYTVDENGYLVQEKINSDTFNTYDKKLKELIEGHKTIIVSVSDSYDAYNETLDETYSIMLEDDEFAVLFEKDSKCSITILNYYHYAEHKDKDTYNDEDEFDEEYFYSDAELMDKFLEVFYQNVNFVELTSNEQTQKELDDLLIDDNEIQYKTPETEIVSKDSSYSNMSEFDVSFYGIEQNRNMTYSAEENFQNTEQGIYIDLNSREVVLNYLNSHCIYTYSVNQNGYLVCDNIEKDNPNLDCKGETEIDKEIAFVIESGLNIIISVSDSYYTNENGVLEKVYFSSEEYTKSFYDRDKNSEILYLNSVYFNLDMGYNPATSDRFTKNLYPKELQTRTFSNSLYGELGTMNTARTVYFGPSSKDYAVVGSVDANEDIVIMGKNAGWYFIAYMVGSTTNFKSGYVPVSTVSNVTNPISEDMFEGGYNYSDSELTVKSCYIFNQAINSGTIYAGEGFTELQRYYEDGRYVSLVEYSTPKGTKRGFVESSNMHISSISNSTVARVIADSSPAYAGADSSYVKLGGVYKNEFISVLSISGDYVYAEYNTTKGRKRGYIRYNDIRTYCIRPYSTDKVHLSLKKAIKELKVYGGPNSNYANIGTVFNQEIVSYLGTERDYSYIEYTTSNGAKRGYVPTNALETATAPTIPNIPIYPNFITGTYGTSGLGKELKWYKIGSGKNVVFAVFEQHGWEDAWAYDGIELVNIANSMMSKLSGMYQSIFNDWSIYVIPYANPDGITDGYTNNGPGRCTVSTKTDMNRCWDANFVPYYTSRNYTGRKAFNAPEAVALKNFITERAGSKTNVVLDIHGWLNKTYGNSEVGAYFGQQFGFSHRSTHGNGYLETWAYLKGYKSCLVELPMPKNSSSITSNNYVGKLTTGLVNMISNISGGSSPEGGTATNELCQIKTNSSVNVRSGPGTSYSKIASLKNGTKVTRIKKAVANANGYTWDKIKLSDGKIGYVATNYLSVIVDDYGYTYNNLYDDVAVIKAYLKHETTLYDDKVVDKNYNWELTDTLEEYQKIYSLKIQDGTINNETLKNMGFSVDSNGKIVRNSYYENYLNISKQHMYRGIYFDNADEPNKYIYDCSNIKFDQEYIDIRNEGEKEWKSMSEDEIEKKGHSLAELAEKVRYASEIYVKILPNASAALGRFVDKSNFGKTLIFEDMNGFFKISDKMEGIFNNIINRNIKAAENFTEYVDEAKFSMEYYVGARTGSSLKREQLDWFMAMNGFVFGTYGNVQKNGSIYVMDLDINIRDYYDWANEDEDPMDFPLYIDTKLTPEGSVLVLETVNETQLYDLNRIGLGKNFESNGTLKVRVSWDFNKSYVKIEERINEK